MKPLRIVVIDYGLGNLYSVTRALEVCGATKVCVSASAEDIGNADRVILPGVGAFGDGMRGLRERGLIEPIMAYAAKNKPLLGICLGMQMLASSSEEFGSHQGLALIPGKVRKILNESPTGEPRKTPFIGWASLNMNDRLSWSDTILKSIEIGDSVYFVHSYYFEPENRSDLLATYCYNGEPVTAAIRRGNVTGLQFHPEKSGQIGLRILREFITSHI
jgi:imidazole glycerol-phosphate synthase subunit HisH